MRILHCISSVNPVGGGVIEAVRQISAINERDGHIVEVLSLDDPASPWVAQCPLTCHALGPGRLGSFAHAPAYTRWLKAHHTGYDVVVINGLWQFHSFGAWLALRRTRTPYVVFSHGMLDPWFKRQYPLKHLKKWLYWPWADYRVLRDAHAVLFTCEEERRLARLSFWLYRAKERVLNFGTGRPPGEAAAQQTAFELRFPATVGQRCLLFLGRLHEKKGVDLLLHAFAGIRRTRKPADWKPPHIIMAGPADDDYGASMKALASKLGLDASITWTGMLTGDEKWGAFRVADAFVLPSHQENFGIAVTEALACGVPVLISNQVNIWREIDAASAGLVADDTLAATEGLLQRWWALDEPARAAMRVNALRCFEAHFNIEVTARVFAEALQTMAAQAAPAA